MSELFTCPFCGSMSRHPKDVHEQYCPVCHVFVREVLEASPRLKEVLVMFYAEMARDHPGRGWEQARDAWRKALQMGERAG